MIVWDEQQVNIVESVASCGIVGYDFSQYEIFVVVLGIVNILKLIFEVIMLVSGVVLQSDRQKDRSSKPLVVPALLEGNDMVVLYKVFEIRV